jgi:hypothetical protein
MYGTVMALAVGLGVLMLVTERSGEAQAAAGDTPPTPYELSVPLSSVMEIVDEVYARMPERLESGKSRDFRILRRESQFIAEMGSLASRVKDHYKKKTWVEYSKLMKTASLSMAEAANKKDADGFKAQYEKVKESCGKCHDEHRD